MGIRLIQGDCLEVMQSLPSKSVDLIICDLPYGVTHNSWDKPLDLAALWTQYNRIAKEQAPILLFATGKFLIELGASNLKDYRHKIVWHKTMSTGFLNAGRAPLRAHEDILVFYRKAPKFNRVYIDNVGKPYVRVRIHDAERSGACYGKMSSDPVVSKSDSSRLSTDVLKFSKDNCRTAPNSTAKPVALLEHLMRMYSDEGMTVLDNCLGSGSTAIAAHNTNRNFIGIELHQPMLDAAKQRLDKLGITYD